MPISILPCEQAVKGAAPKNPRETSQEQQPIFSHAAAGRDILYHNNFCNVLLKASD